MRKHSIIPFALTVIVLFASLVLVGVGAKHSTRRASIQTLCLQAYGGDTNAAASLKTAGSNVVPVLIELTQYRVHAWRKRLPAQVTKLPFALHQRMQRWLTPPRDFTLREAATRALGNLGPDARDTVPVLIRGLHDLEGTVRWESARALANIGKGAVPALIAVLQDKTNSARWPAIQALGLIGPEAQTAIPALIPCLSDSNEQIRGSTESTLKRLGPEAVVAVVRVATYGKPLACESAVRILQQLVSSSEPPIKSLRKLAGDESPGKRTPAMEALGDLRPATGLAVKTLMSALDDPVLEVRLAAIKALRNIGAKARMALPELNRLAGDREESVRAAARQAIERIETAKAAKTVSLPQKAD